MAKLQRPVVSLLVERLRPRRQLLLQRRTKSKDDTSFTGLYELPQGKIEAHETFLEAAARELIEETGLVLVDLEMERPASESISSRAHLYAFIPLLCVVDSINNHVGLAVVATATGDLRATGEASGHRWFDMDELAQLVHADGSLFPLNIPMIEAYILRAAEPG